LSRFARRPLLCPLPLAALTLATSALAQQPPAPITLEADRIESRNQTQTVASGAVVLEQAGLKLTADWLRFDEATQLAIAEGAVRLSQRGSVVAGSRAEVQVDRQRGRVQDVTYHLAVTGGGGHARELTFEGRQRLAATAADYTTCPRDADAPGHMPDWLLSADTLNLDFVTNEGRATGAVLRFMGVPILGAPTLTFPATDQPKSGWLPPTVGLDSTSGLTLALPYYWRIAPNLDATLTPGIISRRGLSVAGQVRYLLDSDKGRIDIDTLPYDRLAGRARGSLAWLHEGEASGWRYDAHVEAASDDAYWRDFARTLPSLTQRLLAQDLAASRVWQFGGQGAAVDASAWVRVQGWQVLQSEDREDLIVAPYQRLPQVGLGLAGELDGWRWGLQGEYNRFVLRERLPLEWRPDGQRVTSQASLTRTWDSGWGWLTPRAALYAASYRTDTAMSDGRTSARRWLPSVSLDTGLRFDRTTTAWDRAVTQTLEPRLHYVYTPYKAQNALPLFDTAPLDFSETSIWADNPFAGPDRISDMQQVTAGLASRWLDAGTGVELLRLGAAQRYMFRDQRLPPLDDAGNSRFSDLLLYGSGSPWPTWRADATVQVSPSSRRTMRSVLALRWQPAPYHVLSGTYRYARDLSEQFDMGWQWPIYRSSSQGGRCQGTLYGVGRVNYSMADKRITDALAGFEYDSGCWIARVVAERISTGQSQATTRLLLQLELVGLSRLGANPLRALKDNIPGYQVLRDDDAPWSSSLP